MKLLLSLILLCLTINNANARTLSDILWESFKEWRSSYNAQADYGITKKQGNYPRLINNFYSPIAVMDTAYVTSGGVVNLQDSVALALSKWDIVSVELHKEPSKRAIKKKIAFYRKIRKLNPDIKLMLYMCLGTHVSRAKGTIDGHIARTLRENNWFLRTVDGELFGGESPLGGVPDYRIPECREWITALMDSLVSVGNYDGIWIDLLRGHAEMKRWIAHYKHKISMNRNKVEDKAEWGVEATIDSLQVNYVLLLKELRNKLGKDKAIYCNPGRPWGTGGGWQIDKVLFKNANGNEIQGDFDIDAWIDLGTKGARYNSVHADSVPFRLFQLDYLTQDTCCCPKLMAKQMRYTFAAALMTDAYYTYTSGSILKMCRPPRNFNQFIWWSEYNVDLGKAIGRMGVPAKDKQGNKYFRRLFENGEAFLNRNVVDTVRVDTRGMLHKNLTTGKEGTSFVVLPKDGLFLERLEKTPESRKNTIGSK